jgi:RHS repeat-associated protein
MKRILLLLVLAICISGVSAQQTITLNSQTSGVYKARDQVRLLPGFRSSAASFGSFNAAIDPRILINAAYQSGDAIPTVNRSLNTSYVAGTTAGSADVSPTGAAIYTIPIHVPVAAGDLQPDLSVAYNSQSGNGLLGYGWSLSGLSMISRTGSTIYHDGKTEGVQLSTNDNLMLDGQRLILTGGTNLTENAVYHTEIENYSTVTMKTINGKLGFEVKTKDGNILQYGASDDSYIEAQGVSTPLCWLLYRVTDVNGNYATYSYEEDNANGEFRIKRIDYGGNTTAGMAPYSSVEFFYETRSDTQTGYVAGTKSTLSVILKRIKTSTNNLTDREYRFNYTYDGLYSKLDEVEEYGSDGSRYNSTAIIPDKLAIEKPNQCAEQSWMRPNYIYEYEDFNNDGKTDILYYPNKSAYPNRDIALVRFYVDDPNGTGGTSETTCYLPSGFDKILIGDFNGDGYKDVLCISKASASVYNYDIFYFNEYNWLYDYKQGKVITSHFTSDSENALCADFNGDGKCEILILNNSPLASNVYTINKDYTVATYASGGVNYFSAFANFRILDFDGDGKMDLMTVEKTKELLQHKTITVNGHDIDVNLYKWLPVVTIYNMPSVSAGITPTFQTLLHKTFNNTMTVNSGTESYINCDSLIYIGDFNGDGKSDIIARSSSFNSDSLYCSNGKSFEKAIEMPSLNNYHSQLFVGDFNGDGKSDLATFVGTVSSNGYYTDLRQADNSTFYVHYLISDGQGKFTPDIVQGDANTYFNHTLYYDNLGVGDFKERGRSSLAFICYPKPYTNEKQRCVQGLFTHKSNDCYLRVGKIIDGYNNTTTFSYKTLSRPNFGTSDNQYAYPLQTLRMGYFAVDSLTTTSGYNISTTTYQYKNLKMHMQGKGLLGFDEITAINTNQNRKIVQKFGFNTTYFNVFPTQELTTTADGKPITTTTYKNDLYSLGGKRIFPYLKEQTTTDSLTGLSATKNFVYESGNDGNPTSVTETKGSLTATTSFVYDKYNSSYKNRATQSTVTNSGLYGTYSSTTTYAYDGLGRLTGKTDFYGNPKAVNYGYGYDNFGNVNSTRISANGLLTATASTVFESTGRFPFTQTDAASLTTTYGYNPLGRLVSKQLPDGETTGYQYNGFGAATAVTPPTGKTITTTTNWDGSGTGLYYTQTTQEGSPATTVWYDALAREVQRQTTGFHGTAVTSTKSYNAKGELEYVTLPYNSGETPRSVNYGYDAYGRFQSQTFNFQTTWYSYNGLSTTIRRPDGNAETTTLNNSGLTGSKTEPEGSTVSYTYTSLGKPRTITANGFTTTLGYDNRGYQNSLTDPNMTASMGYDYNAYGQLASQTTPNKETTAMTYDAAGRLSTKSSPEAVYTYTYNGSSGYGAGQLYSILQGGQPIRQYSYSQYGKVSGVTENIDGLPYVRNTPYDAYNRLSEASSPSGFTVKYEYDGYGYLQRMRDKATNNILWQANAVNALGKVTESQLANGLIRKNDYDTYNLPQNIRLLNGGTSIDEVQYTFDGIKGTLTRRNDISNGRDEGFVYDNLLRLTDVTSSGVTQSVRYYTDGRINTKSDVGTYQYDTGKQQVQKVTDCVEPTFAQTQGTNTYTSTNRISELKQNIGGIDYRLNFAYNSDDQRNKMASYTNDVLTATRYYSGNYEKEIAGTGTKEFDYIYTPEGMAAIAVTSGGTRSFYTVGTDHLGSIRTITDASDNIVSRYWYDAWGNRTLTTGTNIINRGYTGQEHLNQFGLINLNARLYDPKLAQFTGLDPFVQDPGMGQNFNRYSYCLNNPLIYSDPSGNNFFKWLKKTFWDTPWSWLNGTDKGHPGVYSGGVAGTLNKWGVPSFGAGYNSSQGVFYNVGNNPRVYPGQEAALQRQFAAVSAQTQAMIAGERQQQAISEAWYYSIPFIGDFMRAGRDHAQGNYLSMINNMCLGALWVFTDGVGGEVNSIARGTEAAKTGTNLVYEGLDAAGTVRYVGITEREAAVRFAEHLNSGTARSLLDYRVVEGATNLNRTEARVWEQTLINQYGLGKDGGLLLNKINSIAPKNWSMFGIYP